MSVNTPPTLRLRVPGSKHQSWDIQSTHDGFINRDWYHELRNDPGSNTTSSILFLLICRSISLNGFTLSCEKIVPELFWLWTGTQNRSYQIRFENRETPILGVNKTELSQVSCNHTQCISRQLSGVVVFAFVVWHAQRSVYIGH